jgi:sugar diacid utilization regulator/putative methionine-R-sulfoxide reductase with GAF domain
MDRDPEILFLQRLALTAASTATMGDLLRLVIAETTEATGADVCSVYLVDPADGRLVLTATNGLSQDGVGRVRLDVGEGVTGWAAAERSPVVVPDVRDEPRFRWLEEVDQARFVSMCSVPILAADHLVGVLNVQSDRRRELSDAEVGFLSAIAAQVAGVLARTELQERLERRAAELRRSEEVHRRLGELALAGSGPAAVCAAIAALAGAPAAVYDPEGIRIAAGGGGMPERLPRALTDRSLSVTPVRAGDEPLGWLAIATGGTGSAAVRQVAAHGATVLALELVRRRADREAERRHRADLVEELLSARLRREEAEDLADRAARLGHPIPDPAWVIAFELDDPGDGHVVASAHAPHRVADEIRALAATRDSNAFVVERAGGLVVLASSMPDLEAAEDFAAAARELVQDLMGAAAVSCGVGAHRCAPADLRRGAEEARAALRVARRLGERATVASYRRLGIERLLLGIEPPELLEEYVEDWLGPLARAAQGRGAPLVESLEALAHEGWNMRASARRLGIHVNTLLYRLGRIEQILGRELDDPEVRMAMAVALRARRLVGGMEGVIDGARAERRSGPAEAARAPRAAPTLRKLPGRAS